MNKVRLSDACKGMAVGASMLIPGVSGGTMAIILGIYDRLIHGVSSFKDNPKENTKFLFTFAIGAAVGILLFSNLLLFVVTKLRLPMMFLFLGAIAGSVPALYQKAAQGTVSIRSILCGLAGFGLVALIHFIPSGLFAPNADFGFVSFLLLFGAGFIVAVALVLPGISASYMLLALGLYDITLRAITEFHILFLVSLLMGVAAGILLTTSLLERAMQHHPGETYFLIIGFVLGAMIDVFPGVPHNGALFLLCLCTLTAGAAAVYTLSKKMA